MSVCMFYKQPSQVIDCWVDNMLLNFTDNSFRNRDGVQTKVNDFGGKKTCFSTLHLVGNAYEHNCYHLSNFLIYL
jgi:hypothetical protein